MDRTDGDLFDPLHREEPPGAWDRVVAGPAGEASYLDAGARRPGAPRWLVAAVVLLIAGVVGGALLARSGTGEPAADGAGGPCPFTLEVPGIGPFEPVERSTMIPPEDIGPLGAVTVLRAEGDGWIVEVFAGRFDLETFNDVATGYESGPGPGPGEAVVTAVSFTPASEQCTLWGIYATGFGDPYTDGPFRAVVDALSTR